MKKNKKAQEEFVGFAIIIIIVAVIGVIFLGIMIRKNNNIDKIPSKDVENLLDSLLRVTSDCEVSYSGNYLNIQDLIKKCSKKENCLDNRKSCDVLEQDVSVLLNKADLSDNDLNSWKFSVYLSKTNQTIINLNDGNCTDYTKASQTFVYNYPENLYVELEFC